LARVFGLKSNSILVEFFKTEILNNKNIYAHTKISSKKVNPINIDNFLINFKIEDGLINLDSTKFDWLEYLALKISNSAIFVKNDNLIFEGLITIDIKNLDMIFQFFQIAKSARSDIKNLEFAFSYNFFQIAKSARSDIKNLEFAFSYNFDQENIKFNEIKVNNIINENIKSLSGKTFFVKDNFKNQIYFKNFINKFFKSYSG